MIAEPTPEALVALLRGLDPEAIRARAATLLARDDRDFCLTTAEVAAALAPALPVRAVASGGDQRAVGALR